MLQKELLRTDALSLIEANGNQLPKPLNKLN